MKRALLTITTVAAICLSALPAGANNCLTCHAKIVKGKNVHAVADPCETCHQTSEYGHPQKNKKTVTLNQEIPDLCSQCHQKFSAKNVHAPVASGMCTSCHNPHSSNEPKLLTQQAAELCTQCHSDKIGFKYAHGPAAVGDCATCHNPHESKHPALVTTPGADLCFSCHGDLQAVFSKKHVHSAMAGGCTSCHNPHGSPAPHFLSSAGEKVCFQCHSDMEAKITDARVVHQPIKSEKGCASCHSPHAASSEKLLEKSGQDLCFDCHKDFLPKDATVLHGPIKQGKCASCHDPHASAHAKLLSHDFSPDFYVPYTDKAYGLCFKCHKRDLLQNKTTSYATNFRDGERNLHYLHVNMKDKGRSCRLCHLVHGSRNPKLIADKVLFNKWNLPLQFVKTDTGGSCAPGCHTKFNYDRKNPGKTPAQPENEKTTSTRKNR